MKKKLLKDINILYVEDENIVRDLTVNILSKFVNNVVEATNGLEGLSLFEEYNINNKFGFKIDLIVTDINMPKMNGLDMIEEIEKLDSNIPSIITTAHNDAEFLKKAINQRVRGYVTKPLKMDKLVETISIVSEPIYLKKQLEVLNKRLVDEVALKTRELQQMVEQLEKQNDILSHKVNYDDLTKLYNRRKLNDELDKEILREDRYKHGLSILMFDIDDFKNINDTYGHDVGDEVLIDISNILKNSIRATDTACRWGGEEFMILLPETKIDEAFKIAEIIVKNVEIYTHEPVEVPITISGGAVDFIVGKYDKEKFLKNVDIALYQAKHNGKNQVIKYEE